MSEKGPSPSTVKELKRHAKQDAIERVAEQVFVQSVVRLEGDTRQSEELDCLKKAYRLAELFVEETEVRRAKRRETVWGAK